MSWYRKIKIADQMPRTTDKEDPHKGHYGVSEIGSRLSPEQAEQISRSHPDLTYLDEGNQGVVYQIGKESEPGDPLTKLTISGDEFKNVKKILKLQDKHGGQVPGVVHIFHVDKIIDDPINGVYQIYTEHVRRLDEHESPAVSIMCSYALGLETGNTGELIKEIYEYVGQWVNYPLYVSIVGKFLRLVASLKKIDPRGGEEMFWDLKDFNIGVNDNGEYVLFDIGRMKF